MEVRLAFAAAVLALSAIALTPTHTEAAPPSGIVECSAGMSIGFGKDRSNRTPGDAIRSCVEQGGRPERIEFEPR